MRIARDGVARLPGVDDLSEGVWLADALAPVPLVRINTRVELAPEQALERALERRALLGADERVLRAYLDARRGARITTPAAACST